MLSKKQRKALKTNTQKISKSVWGRKRKKASLSS